ncbi:hypothetical protein [Kosmotoga sp. DU53]|uniref:hypothetical protein n=1 Tax=Kosmotoga sp. DU53 TaxID=1310160 RepID=UPI0007C4E5B2|nr:hypothetical protein [Kosmotoga sp. DU53]OAA22736.1 hypothetical protein DU53_03460 [Kosmotoga sp. DU53]
MMLSPKEFKKHLIETTISILWDQWEKLGAWISPEERLKFYSDPEAAIVFSWYFSRYEKRIQKISEEWISANKEHLNTVRLKRMLKELSNKYGITIPIKSRTEDIDKSKFMRKLDALLPENLLPRLRLLFGCSTKAEVIFHLLTMGNSNSNQIAKERFLNQKAVLVELDKLAKTGFLIEKRAGRERIFSISPDFANVLPQPIFLGSVPWVLLSATFMVERCLREDYLDDEYLIFSAFNDFRKTLVSMLNKAMECNVSLKQESAQGFYSSVVDYWICLTKKATGR